MVLAMAWQHIQATRLGYEVESTRRQAHRLKGRIASLQMDLQTSVSPARLASQAKSRLGMFPVSPGSLRIMNSPESAAEKETFFARLLSRLVSSRSA
jgi:hypothetical protein